VVPLQAPFRVFFVKHSCAVKRLYSERKAQEEERTTGTVIDEHVEDQEQDIAIEDDDAADAGQHLYTSEFKERLLAAFAEEKSD
jgi:ribosome assembly protein 1